MKDHNIKIIKTAKHSESGNASELENQKAAPQSKQTKSPPQKSWLVSLLRREEDHIIHIIFLLAVIVLGSCSRH